MNPEPGPGFAALCATLVPGFRATAERIPARKSEVIAGEIAGVPVIAKRLAAPDAVWAWYLARELAIYRTRAPRSVLSDPAHALAGRDSGAPSESGGNAALPMPAWVVADEGVLIVERVIGEPLGRRRDPCAELAPEMIDALLAVRDEIARSSGGWPEIQPSPRVRSQLRSRFLEDPTDPVGWVRDGIARCGKRKLVSRALARLCDAAIAAWPVVAPSHGDLLLRNAIARARTEPSDDGRHRRTGQARHRDEVVLVDWECAGPHLFDWDLALLWTQLGPVARERVESAVRAATPPTPPTPPTPTPPTTPTTPTTIDARWRCFLALVVFALAREISFLIAFRTRDDHPGLVRRRDELAVVGDRLRA